ncbi:hypothetical protein ACG9XR_19930 [Acinetobacter guillouiae]|uniref:hypothetical protein n=1 Tax=Acinetobacter guillouiae TaxID=106649 RepID=UPI003AF6C341
MNDKKLLNLDMLEQDIWFNFCYNYQCDELEIVKGTDSQVYNDSIEKIILSLQTKDFLVNERITYLAELMGKTVSVPFKPFQIAELLKRICALRRVVNHISAHHFQRQYSDILIAYVDTLGEFDSIENEILARSAKATLAVKARYGNHLHPRQEIIHRVLLEQVAQRGRKWDNPNQAVTSIIPILIKEFEKYDLIWVKSEISLKQAELQKLEQDDVHISEPLSDHSIKRKKASSAVKAKKVKNLQDELKKLDSILHSKHPSLKLKDSNYKMPYNNTAYLDETIIHWLRGQPEILKEIVNSI